MKKKIVILLAIIVCLGLIASGVWFFVQTKTNRSNGSGDVPEISEFTNNGSSSVSSDAFGVYGVTSVETIEATFPVEGMTSSLEVEEVYITSGDAVTADTKILKFTDESIATVRKELTAALRSADLAYRAGKITYEQNLITYAAEKETTVLEGKQADTVYNETISSLSSSVDKAKEELDETKEKIAEYETAFANNQYYLDYVEAQNKYDNDLALLMDLMDKHGVAWSEVMRVSYNYSNEHAQYVTICSMLYNVLENDGKVLESAEKTYEESTTSYPYELQILKLSLSGLESDYASAKESYEKSLLEAKLTKQQTLSNAESAEKVYETNVEKAEKDYENLKDNYEDAKEALETFEEIAGTGYLIAIEEGTVLRANLRVGRTVTSDTTLYTVSNPTNMTVSASVSQDDIAKIAVGDTAIVYSEETGMFNATISSINPVTSSSSQSSVTYSVTLTMTGDFSNLATNETVTVYFGMGGN